MSSDDGIRELADRIVGRVDESYPHLVAVAGPVAVGKSTVSQAVATELRSRGKGVHVISTDAFLFPNAVLDERGLAARKGFPESFDVRRLDRTLRQLRAGAWPVEIPVYSHLTYDIVPDDVVILTDCDLVIVEGVNVLQDPFVGHFSVTVYVDADDADLRRWFTDRLLTLVDDARWEPTSFYHPFIDTGPDDVRRFADAVWDGINAVNLREHIEPSKANAMIVVKKDGGHAIVDVAARDAAAQ